MENENINKEVPLSDLLQIRRDKLQTLVDEGKNPFELTSYPVDAYAGEIRENYVESEEKRVVRIAGRIMSRRIMGKASFAHVMDNTGTIQVYVKRDDVGEDVYRDDFKKWDIGDIIGVEGFVFTTKTGEISVHATSLTLLAKSLLPLPEKFHGLTNQDLRYRQRYVLLFE